MKETIYGYISNDTEALKLLEMVIEGVLPRVTQRLTDREKEEIRVGSIFVYEEKESSISRWTDGREWSTSKIRGRSLCYNEIVDTSPLSFSLSQGCSPIRHRSVDEILEIGKEWLKKREVREVRKGGLIKKTISAKDREKVYHIVSYYSDDFLKTFSRGSERWREVLSWPLRHGVKLHKDYRRGKKSKDMEISPYLSYFKLSNY